jgi:hypothetical protein
MTDPLQNILEKPPSQVYRPLKLFDEYISSLYNKRPNEDVATQRNTSDICQHEDILRIVHSLFGKTSEAAMKVLDQCSSNVTCISSAESKRYIYIIMNSSDTSSKGSGDYYYYCLFPDEPGDPDIFYCSCRAYWERNRIAKNEPSICKHLLALKLMPLFNVTCARLELPTEKEFAQIVAQRIGFA